MIGFVLIALIAALHVYIMVLEMALWESPRAMKAFGTTPEFAAKSKVLAANQGLYNGFLAAGLVLGLWLGIAGGGRTLVIYLLACVIVAGLYGAVTVGRKILFIQALPAALALATVLTGV
jgi:putative membrane protein